MADLLLSPGAALLMALALTGIAALESRPLPWSPFLLAYAVLLPLPPLLLGGYALGPFGAAFSARPLALGGLAALVLAWEIVVAGLLYDRVLLARAGKAGSPRWSPSAALETLLAAVRAKTGWSRARVDAVYGVYFLAWAPVAEELFYWGYLYPCLREAWSFPAAALATSALFGARHALHFLYLPDRFPWPAALAFAATAGVSGLLNSALLEVSGSLWPCLLLHFASNLAAALGEAGRPRGPSPGADP